MVMASASFTVILSLSLGTVGATWWLSLRLTPEDARKSLTGWLAGWSVRGILIPLALWAVMNLGISWNLQPFMPEVQAAQNSGLGWAQEFLHVFAAGALILSTYWATVTLGWVLWRASGQMQPEPRRDFKTLCGACALALGIPALILLLIGGWTLLGLAGMLMVGPLAWYAPVALTPPKLPPMYARAVARMKFGKYSEAEWEIIRELEKAEDDFEGWMMLAELYAVQFRDLPEAERVVFDLCDQPKLPPSQLAVALHRLADWQLKIGDDPQAARKTLQVVCERIPGTHLAHMAQLRRNQIPSSSTEYRHQQSPPPIPLPALGDKLDAPHLPAEAVDKAAAARAANACVDRLRADPNNAVAREKLARIFTEQLNRPELGLEQLELLLCLPGATASQHAAWLSLMAAWQLKYRLDIPKARSLLERLIGEHPESPEAFAARRRLDLLNQQQPAPAPAKGPIRINLGPNSPNTAPPA